MFRRLALGLLGRRLCAELAGIHQALDAQTQLLARLADHVAPATPSPDRAAVVADTGLSYLDAVEAELAADYVARTQRDTGHTPDDEEVLIYLADEKTTDLHARLTARAEELTRLAETRAWR
jgi:hypothetical protein